MENTPEAGPGRCWPKPGAGAVISIVPVPERLIHRAGKFLLDGDVRIVTGPATMSAARLLRQILQPGTGLDLQIVTERPETGGVITLRIDRGIGHSEGYVIDSTPDKVVISGRTADGLHWGIQTFRQLLPADCLRAAPTAPPPFPLPCGRIEDAPRFSWRGLMLDVARHFMPKSFLLKIIDAMELHRLNILHLHLTDDQGWRLEVPAWPRLAACASWRPYTEQGPVDAPQGNDGTPHGGVYSLADMAEVVAYAARRNITVMPEFGFPGHVQAALSAYPELGNTGPHEVCTRWGHSPHVLAPNDSSLRFISEVLDVILDIFSSPYIHIGGDECSKQEWRASAKARAKAAGLGLKSVDELQSWFLRHGAARIMARGRRPVGWDHVLEDGGVPLPTIVMVWRDFAAGDILRSALRSGHDVVSCPTRTTYLDRAQADSAEEPYAHYGITTIPDLEAYDPEPRDLAGQGAGRVLGTQAHLWTEYMPHPASVEYMAFPRLGVLAEAAWSSVQARAAVPFAARAAAYVERLAALGFNCRPLPGPLPWQARPRP